VILWRLGVPPGTDADDLGMLQRWSVMMGSDRGRYTFGDKQQD